MWWPLGAAAGGTSVYNGKAGSRRDNMWNGEYPVVLCTEELYAKVINSRQCPSLGGH